MHLQAGSVPFAYSADQSFGIAIAWTRIGLLGESDSQAQIWQKLQ